jgi:hypothetical protein
MRSDLRAGAGGARQPPIAPGGEALGAYRVIPRGPGPAIAGHATAYHVITYHDDICAEMLVSGGMRPFMAPVVQAIDALEDMPTPAHAGGCARIPFAVYAAAGWPMLAGKIDHLTFETRAIRFDYQPTSGELATADDGRLTVIRDAIWPGDGWPTAKISCWSSVIRARRCCGPLKLQKQQETCRRWHAQIKRWLLKLVWRFLPTITWSWTASPTAAIAWTTCLVISTSARDGVGSPLG